jgi:hypothetical protein
LQLRMRASERMSSHSKLARAADAGVETIAKALHVCS